MVIINSHNIFVGIFASLYVILSSSYFFCYADEKCVPAVPYFLPTNKTFGSKFLRRTLDEDIFLNITELLTKYGYRWEEHEVETSDGYMLTMFRIPSDGPAVMVMHGFLCSSDDFLTSGTKRGLAYLLADAKYDVWLGNARGNKHSRKHVRLSPDCADFWQFTWDEIGRYDLPAMIDYALNVTGKTKLAYVGHSQGSTSFFVMASERPEYNEKVSISIILSAVVYLENTSNNLLRLFAPFSKPAMLLTDLTGLHEFGARGLLVNSFIATFCGTPLSAALVCLNILYTLDDFDNILADFTTLPVIFSHYPAGASTDQQLHYGQVYNSKEFRRFNIGKKKNLELYGSETPPKYPLEKITGKMVIFFSENDSLTTKPDLKRLLSELNNDVEVYHVPRDTLTHFGFIYARDIDTIVNNKVIEYINENHN